MALRLGEILEFMMLSRVSLPLIRLVRQPMHVFHTLMPCLLLLPVHLLPPQLHVALHAHQLMLVCACMMMAHLCMVLAIQVVLVASCLCRGPPVTTRTIRRRTRVGLRVPREGGVPKVGFRSVSRRWWQGYILGWPAVYGGRLQVHFPGGNQALVQDRSREAPSHLPSTRGFLTPGSRHLNVGWASSNQWAGRRCVTPHVRGFGC